LLEKERKKGELDKIKNVVKSVARKKVKQTILGLERSKNPFSVSATSIHQIIMRDNAVFIIEPSVSRIRTLKIDKPVPHDVVPHCLINYGEVF